MKIIIWTALLFLTWSCNFFEKRISKKETYYSDGHIKSQTTYHDGVKDGTEINYYYSGSIASIKNYINGNLDGEQLWFYDNGFVEQKRVFKLGIPNGPWYVFYPSGAVQNFRYTINNKDVAGADYWDDTVGIIKSTLHFNDSGQIYFKKNFDQFGSFISEEGKRPKYR